MLLPASFRLLILGQGSTGLALARWAVAHLGGCVESATVYGGATSRATDATHALESQGVSFVYGTEEIEGAFDICVASPGISERSEFFARARAHAGEIMGEPEFAWRLSPERWIGITGTNGKTTTTTLTDRLLNGAGITSVAVGNIGDCIISCVDSRPAGSWFTAELSSYQLATTREFHPSVGMLLNITPDHLAWHGSHEAYALAKCKLFANMTADDLIIVDGEDAGVASVMDHIALAGRRIMRFGIADCGGDDAAYVRDGMLCVRLGGVEHELVSAGDLKIQGDHNFKNALAASAAALFVGADVDVVRRGLISFAPLEHRVEPAGELDGVRFVNDSKATNTDAVEKALTAFTSDRVILLLGGHDKGTPLDEFAKKVVSSTVRAVVCFGDARERFRDAMLKAAEGSDEIDIADAENLRDAVDVARSLASRGDVVLLSPACSSFDEFSGFEERGTYFKDYIKALQSREAE